MPAVTELFQKTSSPNPSLEEVRETMLQLGSTLSQHALGDTARTSTEIVVTEVLNNIVEHALPTTNSGWFSVTCWRQAGCLRFEIADNGISMPHNQLPAGLPPNIDTELQDLPEGGWGWSLVRSLTQDLNYQRVEPVNTVQFVIPDAPETALEDEMQNGA